MTDTCRCCLAVTDSEPVWRQKKVCDRLISVPVVFSSQPQPLGRSFKSGVKDEEVQQSKRLGLMAWIALPFDFPSASALFPSSATTSFDTNSNPQPEGMQMLDPGARVLDARAMQTAVRHLFGAAGGARGGGRLQQQAVSEGVRAMTKFHGSLRDFDGARGSRSTSLAQQAGLSFDVCELVALLANDLAHVVLRIDAVVYLVAAVLEFVAAVVLDEACQVLQRDCEGQMIKDDSSRVITPTEISCAIEEHDELAAVLSGRVILSPAVPMPPLCPTSSAATSLFAQRPRKTRANKPQRPSAFAWEQRLRDVIGRDVRPLTRSTGFEEVFRDALVQAKGRTLIDPRDGRHYAATTSNKEANVDPTNVSASASAAISGDVGASNAAVLQVASAGAVSAVPALDRVCSLSRLARRDRARALLSPHLLQLCLADDSTCDEAHHVHDANTIKVPLQGRLQSFLQDRLRRITRARHLSPSHVSLQRHWTQPVYSAYLQHDDSDCIGFVPRVFRAFIHNFFANHKHSDALSSPIAFTAEAYALLQAVGEERLLRLLRASAQMMHHRRGLILTARDVQMVLELHQMPL